MTDTLCAVCRRRRPEVGLLCGPDLDRLSRHLDPANAGVPFDSDNPGGPVRPPSIPQLYREHAAGIEVGWHDNAEQQRTELAQHALVDEHAISVRDIRSRPDVLGPDDRDHAPRSVLAELLGWARTVSAEHLDIHGHPDPIPPLAQPAWVEVRCGGRTTRIPAAVERPDVQAVTTLAAWLHARLHWLAAQPWVDELITDLRAVTASLRAGQGDAGARPLGPCTGLVDADGQPVDDPHAVADDVEVWVCAEPLWLPDVPPRAVDDRIRPFALPTVRCRACGAAWSGISLLEFARDRSPPETT